MRKTKPSIATADISVYGEAGELVARITGLRARRVPKALLGERVLRENWFYQIDWVRQPLPPLPRRGRAGESYVIFADGGGVGDLLARRLEAEGHRCARIYAGEKRQQVDLRYYIDPACRGDYTWALKEIACRDGALGTLVNLWPLDAAPVETITAPRLAAEQRMVCGGVLDVIHALAGVGLPQRSDLWVVTAGAQAVGDDTPLTGLVASSLWGLGRVFDLEHRDQRMTRVDLDFAVSDPETHAMHLLTELRANTRESQVAYRSGMRHIARLAHAENSRAPLLTSPVIRQNATYLISGGLGSLGLVCARWLVTQGARHVALLGRHPPTVAASVMLDELRQLGARIDVIAADVTDDNSVSEALSSLAATSPPLAGVIHAAGNLKDGLLTQQAWGDFEQVMAPKVLGAWNLHRYTWDKHLDFFVLFSSAGSLLGSAGQGAYAAANAFLDMLAWHRRQRGLPAISINWGPWSIGMAASSATRTRLDRNGIKAISPEQGEMLLERVLARKPTQIGVLNIDWSRSAGDRHLRTMPFFNASY